MLEVVVWEVVVLVVEEVVIEVLVSVKLVEPKTGKYPPDLMQPGKRMVAKRGHVHFLQM